MDTTADEIEPGWSARGRDGRKIGDVEEVGVTHLVVSRGVLAPADLYVPLDAVEAVDRDAGAITLRVDSGDVDDLGWTDPPAPGAFPPDGGVEGLGYTGRDAGDNSPRLAEDGVDGLGFSGRDVPGDGFDGESPRH